MEAHPEENHNCKHQEQGHHAFFGLLRSEGVHNLGLLSFGVTAFNVLEPAAEGIVDGDRNDEGHACHCKREVVGGVSVKAKGHGPFPDLDGCGRGKQGADIDGHVEEGEAGVALCGVLGVVVEVSNHNLEVAFEKTRAEANQEKGRQHGHKGYGAASKGNGKKQVTCKHDHDAGGDHFPEAEFIGHDTSDEGEEVHQHEE